jgi:hypothetical protein
MKSAGAIHRKLEQVRFRYLKKSLEQGLRRTPSNCVHNASAEHPLVPEHEVQLCTNPDFRKLGVPLMLCDSEYENRAPTCSAFCLRQTKEDIKATFKAEMTSLTVAEIAAQYPDMAALMWVLEEDPAAAVIPEVYEEEGTPDLVQAPIGPVSPHMWLATPVSLWTLFKRFLGIEA